MEAVFGSQQGQGQRCCCYRSIPTMQGNPPSGNCRHTHFSLRSCPGAHECGVHFSDQCKPLSFALNRSASRQSTQSASSHNAPATEMTHLTRSWSDRSEPHEHAIRSVMQKEGQTTDPSQPMTRYGPGDLYIVGRWGVQKRRWRRETKAG